MSSRSSARQLILRVSNGDKRPSFDQDIRNNPDLISFIERKGSLLDTNAACPPRSFLECAEYEALEQLEHIDPESVEFN